MLLLGIGEFTPVINGLLYVIPQIDVFRGLLNHLIQLLDQISLLPFISCTYGEKELIPRFGESHPRRDVLIVLQPLYQRLNSGIHKGDFVPVREEIGVV